jgi:hypothetical protein
MTDPFWFGLGLGMALIAFVWVFQSVRGCTGGHHFSDEPTDVRWKLNPYHEYGDKYSITRIETYECNHEDCYAEETERTFVGDPKHRDAVEQIVEEELVNRPNYGEYSGEDIARDATADCECRVGDNS